MKLLLATHNKDKIKEIKKALEEFDITILSLDDYPDMPDIIEDGETLQENSLKKAKEIFEYSRITTLADDTGLDVDFLNGAPGVFAARYAGENATYADNCAKLLNEMKPAPDDKRSAAFRCVITLFGNQIFEQVEGRLNGKIISKQKGTDGFGYDPVFLPDGFDKTLAELTLEEKNKISHRGLAVKKMAEVIKSKQF